MDAGGFSVPAAMPLHQWPTAPKGLRDRKGWRENQGIRTHLWTLICSRTPRIRTAPPMTCGYGALVRTVLSLVRHSVRNWPHLCGRMPLGRCYRNPMSILLGDITAFRLWRSAAFCTAMYKTQAVPLPVDNLGCHFQSVGNVRTRSELLANLPLPLDLFVPEKADRLRSTLATAHRLPPFLATEPVYPLGNDAFVCSPRTTLLQLARTRSFIELALAVFEMCGTYGRCPQNEGGFF